MENVELVKGRILRALRKKEGCWMPHGEVVSAIVRPSLLTPEVLITLRGCMERITETSGPSTG